MRLVFDTNVFLAAFISRGLCHELLEHCAVRHELYTSEFIVGEVRSKMAGKLRVPLQDIGDYETLLRERCSVVAPSSGFVPICRDPDDDMVLATAVAAEADCLVTGDKDLLVIGICQGIPIIQPAHFWSFEAEFTG